MEYKNYSTTLENLKKDLKKNGVAVIHNILDNKEINEMRVGMWQTLEHISKKFKLPINRNDKESWKSYFELYPLHSMLLQHFGLGHAQFIWNIRQNPKIVSVFSKLWNCKNDELLTSYDGLSIHFPPEITKRGWYRSNDWLHTDQSYVRNNLECIQSFISGYDIEEGDATLTVLEGSHKFHKEFSKKFNIKNTEDWYKLNEIEYKFYIDKGCKRTCIKCPAGSLVLWDSRTIHSGMESLKERKNPKLRFVVYVCQTPRKFANPSILLKKQKAFEEGRITNHWPHKPKLFPKTPRTYGKPLPEITLLKPAVLTELGKKLAGY